MESGRCEKVVLGHEAYIHALVVTKDCENVTSGSFDGTVRLWSIESGTMRKRCLGIKEKCTRRQ